MQRLRVRFSRGPEVKFISHLDIMRFWERAFRRSRIRVAYSEGFTPHPRIALAAPLPVGVTSDAELMDVVLNVWMTPQGFSASVTQQLTPGFGIVEVMVVSPTLPSLQSLVSQAEYRVELSGKDRGEVETAISNLLAQQTLPWHHKRDTGEKTYDIRRLIDDLWIIDLQGEALQPCKERPREANASFYIGMRLSCGNAGSGRPEQVAAALGFSGYPESIQRTGLILEGN
jgi:radical SAM-linked protein